jgi:hypothetical protein
MHLQDPLFNYSARRILVAVNSTPPVWCNSQPGEFAETNFFDRTIQFQGPEIEAVNEFGYKQMIYPDQNRCRQLC